VEAQGYPDARCVGSWPGGILVAMLPTDVQFVENDDALMELYMTMSADVEGILDTISLNN